MSLFGWFFLGWLLEIAVLVVFLFGRQVSPGAEVGILSVVSLVTWGLFFLLKTDIRHAEQGTPFPSLIQEIINLTDTWHRQLKDNKEALELLEKELDRWHEVLEGIPFPTTIINTHGEILFANQGFQKTFPVKRFCWEIPSHHFTLVLEDLLQKGQGTSPPFAVRDRYYSIFLAPLLEGRFLLLFVDQTEEILREQREKNFIAQAAHELKTPLTALQGYLEILEPTITPQQEKSFSIIQQHLFRLIRLSQDLLSLQRGEFAPLQKEACDLREIILRIAEMFAPRFAQKGLCFTKEIADSPLIIEADPLAIEEILVNLLDNALRYTDTGEVKLTLTSSENKAIITCEDTGIGISEKDLPNLFQRFYVADRARSRQTGGTGLGLALVKTLVQRHHGELSVKSEKNKGSCFTVILPLEQPQEKPS